MSEFEVRLVSESAVLVVMGQTIDPQTNLRVHSAAKLLMEQGWPGVEEFVPGYATLLVYFDPLLWEGKVLATRIRKVLRELREISFWRPRKVVIPVRYGGVWGPDLDFVAEATGLNCDEVIRLHSQSEYVVFMMGFTPGFAYLGGMNLKLSVPRLETPRSQVPAGSVGIAGAQTGIYPIDSPGGWRIIGRTPLRLFDPQSERPFLLSPGDRVCFEALEGEAP